MELSICIRIHLQSGFESTCPRIRWFGIRVELVNTAYTSASLPQVNTFAPIFSSQLFGTCPDHLPLGHHLFLVQLPHEGKK
jgi:hypothetical protein